MNTLDSRSLRIGDCFGQRFTTPGEVRYFLSAGTELIPAAQHHSDDGHLIRVNPAVSGAMPQQHNVHVVRKGHTFQPSIVELEIRAGDGVLWYTTDASIVGFHVAGAGETFHFSSASLQKDAIYTHVFGSPGKYEWRDPSDSGLYGSIEVEAVLHHSSEERAAWYESLKKPATFEIKGRESSPSSVKIVVGQTVFWSIDGCEGVAITDSQLLSPRHQ
jgi:plastocyanin